MQSDTSGRRPTGPKLIYSRAVKGGLLAAGGVVLIVSGAYLGAITILSGLGLASAASGAWLIWRSRIDPSLQLDDEQRGTVWWGTVQYSDGSGSKDRPVVEMVRYHDRNGRLHVIGYATTSQTKRENQPGYIKISTQGWGNDRKHRSSYANITRLVNLSGGTLRRKSGELRAYDAGKLEQQWLAQQQKTERKLLKAGELTEE